MIVLILTLAFVDGQGIIKGLQEMNTLDFFIVILGGSGVFVLGSLIRKLVKVQMSESLLLIESKLLNRISSLEKTVSISSTTPTHDSKNNLSEIINRLEILEASRYKEQIALNNHLLQREVNRISANALANMGNDDLKQFLENSQKQIDHITEVNERNNGEGIKKKDAIYIVSEFMTGAFFKSHMDTK